MLLELEDGSLLRLSEETAGQLALREGMELTDALREALAAAPVREEAVRLVGSRALSRRELERKLEKKGGTPEDIRDTADWLEDIGALDDRNYAGVVARHYAARGYGPGRVRQELQRRGIPREHWEEALEELPPPEEAITAYLEKKCRVSPPDDRERKRLADGLLRRGFSWGDIRPALERLGGTLEDD